MSIVLEVKDYCSECPDFDAKVRTHNFGEMLGCLTEVHCTHERRCAGLVRYLEQKLKGDQDGND